jgi:hypothetical protein
MILRSANNNRIMNADIVLILNAISRTDKCESIKPYLLKYCYQSLMAHINEANLCYKKHHAPIILLDPRKVIGESREKWKSRKSRKNDTASAET